MHIVTPEEQLFKNQSNELRSVAKQTEPPRPYRVIEVSDIECGEGSIIATFTLKVGGILIHEMSLRQGRNSVYLNFPSRKDKHGRWIHLVEIISPKLESFIQETCYKAVSEALP